MVHYTTVQLCDAIPSARCVTREVRIVLWGIVEAVAIDDADSPVFYRKTCPAYSKTSPAYSPTSPAYSKTSPDYTISVLDTKISLPVPCESSQGNSYLTAPNCQEELEAVDISYHGNIDSNDGRDIYFNIDDLLPAAFGSSKKSFNQKKKKKAKAKEESASTKRKYGKLVDDDEYLCPDGYVWKVDLPTPHKSFVESNLFAVRLPQSVSDLPHDRKTIYNFSDIETQEHCLNLVRVLGCGPGPRDSGKSTGSSASSENTIPGKKVETTCLVELLSNKIAGEKIILQVKRNDLIEIVDINNPKLVVVLSNTWQRLHIKNPEYEGAFHSRLVRLRARNILEL